jgi:hypothetical protein
MKKGDVVTIDDGSFTRSVVDGKLIKESLNYGNEKGKQYVIIETGCSFPNTGSRGFAGTSIVTTFNNTVIQAIDSGKVVFIEERFLKLVPPTHEVVVDIIFHPGYGIGGKIVEISDKLYKEIKRDS